MTFWKPGYLSRQQQKAEQERLQREAAEYRKKMEQIAADFIKDNSDLKVGDINYIFNVIQQRLNKSFNDKEIKSLLEDYGEDKDTENP